MKIHHDCEACMMRQAREVVALTTMDAGDGTKLLRLVQELVSRANPSISPPVLAQQVHRLIRETTGNPDPYAAVRRQLNQRAEKMHPDWHRRFHDAFSPLEAAIRMAIVGNLLDVGAKTRLDDDAVMGAFQDALTAPLRGSVGLGVFADAIRNARSILYLADNAGEIVFDRDLLTLMPAARVTFVVRGHPVLNDATLADAREAGLTDVCEIIDNGSDAPGTVLEDCSPEFRSRFEAADLVIAKGQGNYETLADTTMHIFFLLKIKCPVLAESIGWPCGSLVLKHHQP